MKSIFTYILLLISFAIFAQVPCETLINIATPNATIISTGTLEITATPLVGNGQNATYVWDMGDGNTVAGNPINYDYSADGTYTICLTVSDSFLGCSYTVCEPVNIYGTGNTVNNCDASFSVSQDPLTGNHSFIGAMSNVLIPGLLFSWDFGDGTSSTLPIGNNSFLYDGIYTVCCTVEITGDCTDTYCQDITVYNSTTLDSCSLTFSYNLQGSTYVDFDADPLSSTSISYVIHNWSINGSTLNNGSETITLNLTPNMINTVCNEAYIYDIYGDVCVATYCEDITLGNNPSNLSCDAFFYYNQIDSVTFNFTSITNAQSASWGFGDGNTATGLSVIHSYSNFDSAQVCLYTESIDVFTGQYCNDTTCIWIDSQGNNNPPPPPSLDSCNALFSYGSTAAGLMVFTALQPNISGTSNYSWDFGNGTSSMGDVSSTNFYSNGTYNVCLTVSDSTLACSNTYCELVTVGSNNLFTSTIDGIVNLAGDDFAIVYLIEYNANDSSLNIIDASIASYLNNGAYTFSSVADGAYLVKAALIPGSEFYWDYLPTYYGDVELWSSASDVVVNGSSVSNVDINLIAGTNTGGPGFIAGLIVDGAGKVEGTPIAEAEVILYNELNQPIAYTYTDENGNYNFGDLAIGTYFLTVDVPGMEFIFFEVEITNANPSVDGVNLTSGILVNLDEISFLQNVIYPNPNKGSFAVQFDGIDQNVNLEILNSEGKIVATFLVSNNAMISTPISPGIYFLKFYQDGTLVAFDKMVVR